MTSKAAATTAGALSLGSAGIWGATKLANSKNGSNQPNTTFDGASHRDTEILNSGENKWDYRVTGTWKEVIEVEVTKNTGEVIWRCNLSGFVTGPQAVSKSKEQKEALIEALKDQGAKKIFTENCSINRVTGEIGGGFSTIEFELESDGNSLKDLKKVYTENSFKGLNRLENSDLEILKNKNLTIEKKKEEGKVIFKDDKGWFCSISGTLPSDGLGSNTFDENKLSEILKKDPTNLEKQILVKNCVINSKQITGLTIEKTNNGNKWIFKDLEEKLIKKIYRNPS